MGDGHQSVSWSGHGFRLTVPAGAVPAGTTISLAVKSILDGEFDLPEDCHLMSAIYWIHASQLFERAVTLHLEHCAVIESEAECSEYQFLAGRCSQADLPYLLKMREGGVFTPHSYEASISVKQFSFYAITHFGRKRPPTSYIGRVFYQPFQGMYVWQMDYLVTRDIPSLLEVSLCHDQRSPQSCRLFSSSMCRKITRREVGSAITSSGWSFKSARIAPHEPLHSTLPSKAVRMRSGWFSPSTHPRLKAPHYTSLVFFSSR